MSQKTKLRFPKQQNDVTMKRKTGVTIMPNRKIEFKLKELLIKKGMTQSELAKQAGIREATISNIVNNKYERIFLDHLVKILVCLQIEDISEIMHIVFKDNEGSENHPEDHKINKEDYHGDS